MSLVQRKLIHSVHFVPSNNTGENRRYEDNLDPAENTNPKLSTFLPSKNKEGKEMIMEHGLCEFKD